MEHKFKNIVQVGDLVKYTNGSADYHVRLIHSCGELCDLIRNNEYANEYTRIPISKLEIITKNPKLLSHKEIKDFTKSKEYYEKTNPHKKVGMKKTKPKQLDYLVTQYAPLISVNSLAGENDNVYSRKVIKGEKALADYIIELDKEPVRYQTEVRILGREVTIDIKREVTIK